MTGCLEGSCSIQLSYGVKSSKNDVGVAGFEPTTFCSQSRRDTGLRYTPKKLKVKKPTYNQLAPHGAGCYKSSFVYRQQCENYKFSHCD